MKLYFADGEDLLHRAGPYQTLIVLADNETAAREVISRENPGFRIDGIEVIRDLSKAGDRASCGRLKDHQH